MAVTSVDGLLRTYSEDVQQLGEAARRAIKQWVPGVSEAVDASERMLAYSHGPGYAGMVCTLILSKTGIKLGIFEGASTGARWNELLSWYRYGDSNPGPVAENHVS